MPLFHERLQRLEHHLDLSPLAELQALSDAELNAKICALLQEVLATETDAELRTHSAALLALMQTPPTDPTCDRQGQLETHRHALRTHLRASREDT